MKNLALKIVAVLFVLSAIFVSPGWVKDITVEEKKSLAVESVRQHSVDSIQQNSKVTVTGVSLENSSTGIYNFKPAVMRYAEFY